MRRFLFVLLLISVGVLWIGPALAQERDSLKGKFLIASPKMDDPNFSQTVVLMIEHDADGALGLVLNRRMATGPLGDLLEPMGLEKEGRNFDQEINVHIGGPVELGRAFVLHSEDYKGETTVDIIKGVALTSHPEILKAISEGEGPKRFFLIMGYAGWMGGQLESELQRGGWETSPSELEIILDDQIDTKWQRAMDLVSVGL